MRSCKLRIIYLSGDLKFFKNNYVVTLFICSNVFKVFFPAINQLSFGFCLINSLFLLSTLLRPLSRHILSQCAFPSPPGKFLISLWDQIKIPPLLRILSNSSRSCSFLCSYISLFVYISHCTGFGISFSCSSEMPWKHFGILYILLLQLPQCSVQRRSTADVWIR